VNIHHMEQFDMCRIQYCFTSAIVCVILFVCVQGGLKVIDRSDKTLWTDNMTRCRVV